MNQSDRYDGSKFNNTHPVEVMQEQDYWATTKEWFANRDIRSPKSPIPIQEGKTANPTAIEENELRITWMGHSTLLLEIDGARFLTDPVWCERASPSQWVGPKRFHPPPIPLDQLPPLDGILISHDHYDHLDMETVSILGTMDIPFYAPLGVGAHLESWGVLPEHINEFDWWETTKIDGHDVQLVSTPAQHFSGRGLLDRNATLWTSWTIIGPHHRIFFSGDTGLTDEFIEVGQKYGPFDVTMLEVGAYHPSWGGIHLGPAQAIKAHQMLRGGFLIPIHWGTFDLGLHGWREPGEEILELGAKHQIQVLTPLAGQPLTIQNPLQTDAWWRSVPPKS
jgi:L-ascorbate metabolism protein UlaG (beta-lactamase superfamily)